MFSGAEAFSLGLRIACKLTACVDLRHSSMVNLPGRLSEGVDVTHLQENKRPAVQAGTTGQECVMETVSSLQVGQVPGSSLARSLPKAPGTG